MQILLVLSFLLSTLRYSTLRYFSISRLCADILRWSGVLQARNLSAAPATAPERGALDVCAPVGEIRVPIAKQENAETPSCQERQAPRRQHHWSNINLSLRLHL